ncbi:DNA polymerase I [Legionella birminghamensis]|uniref:DNA polymerase I n=1 Tax=Legionella birminghamensis TaxID=28083 RepID=A0A378I5X8_9GAMM|nr:DNA polymerase I [Legionella birminghamensis]KTC70179.1 DNA polymerase I [Legionella birminghamensis]STX30413.1 DNA polymerase I [Legionella birminghamensis]
MNDPLILVDGSSYFFRAFHALPPLTNSKGMPTGAVYGVANMIKRLLKDYPSSQFAVVFDAKGKTFRDDWYPEYKAHRAAMPNELFCQFDPLCTLLEAMGIPMLTIEGVEADDVIGTLAKLATEQNISVIISTSDKDMAQLVNANVTLVNTMSGQVLDIEGVKTKFGVSPEQIIDYLTLIGDSIDNVPGVNKCGPKTAVKWLEQYQTLDKLIEEAHSITGKIGENLRESLAHLPLSKRLVTIKTDVELPVMPGDLRIASANQARLIELVRELEFKTWLKELLEQAEADIQESSEEPPKPSFEIIVSEEKLNALLAQLTNCRQFCINTETRTSNLIDAEITGISIAIEEQDAVYIPIAHQETSPQLPLGTVLEGLKPILEDASIAKLGHDLKQDYTIFKHYGIELRGISFDTMLESYVLNSSAGTHDLDSLSLKFLGHKPLGLEAIAGKGARQLSFDQIPVEKAAYYAAENAGLNLQLHEILYGMMDQPLRNVFNDIEIPLLTVLADMERRGVLIDTKALAEHGLRLKARILELETEAIEIAGKPFNLNSPKQLQEILFDQLQLPAISKTPTGQPSTAEAVLQELAFDYRLPAIILEYRGLSKLVSTYIDALPKRINAGSGRVHTSYNQAVAATGRLSSSDPNLQNIPIRNEEGRLIRTAFIAPPDHVILAADYSQIELRIMAHLSQDDSLLTAFSNNWDIHSATASEIFQVPLEEVTQEQRRRTKAVNFGLIYGMSSFGLAKQLGIDRQDAQFYMDTYFKRYPGVLEYMERTRRLAHQQGYVETLFGRRLHLQEINSRNLTRQRAAERIAINAPMQGTAADIIKKAMLSINQWQLENANTDFQMIMQVHDELVFEVKKECVELAKDTVIRLMENVVSLSVPLKVSAGLGLNWGEAH